MSTVLIVDDDPSVQKVLEKVILANGMEPVVASGGKEAISLLTDGSFDLMILDVMMKDMDGFEVAQAVRGSGSTIPIMFLSGKTEEFDTLYGLSIGGDDYVTKPFNPVVLGAKVKAMIRRNRLERPGGQKVLSAGPFRYNQDTMKFYKDGTEIPLSSKENILMKFFLQNIDRVFSKEQIYRQVWGDALIDENAVMVYISHLRNKLEENAKRPRYLKTVWGLGYKFTVGQERRRENK